MAALSYKARFAEYVENGLKNRPGRVKRQTIRNFRKYPIKLGERLFHYYAQRTKQCRKLGESVAKKVNVIKITTRGVTILQNHQFHTQLRRLKDLNYFAILDGFDSWQEMKRWWKLTHGPDCFPFTGQLIRW